MGLPIPFPDLSLHFFSGVSRNQGNLKRRMHLGAKIFSQPGWLALPGARRVMGLYMAWRQGHKYIVSIKNSRMVVKLCAGKRIWRIIPFNVIQYGFYNKEGHQENRKRSPRSRNHDRRQIRTGQAFVSKKGVILHCGLISP